MATNYSANEVQAVYLNSKKAREKYMEVREDTVRNIVSYLRKNSGKVFTATELSNKFGLHRSLIGQLLAALKYSNGKYARQLGYETTPKICRVKRTIPNIQIIRYEAATGKVLGSRMTYKTQYGYTSNESL